MSGDLSRGEGSAAERGAMAPAADSILDADNTVGFAGATAFSVGESFASVSVFGSGAEGSVRESEESLDCSLTAAALSETVLYVPKV